MGPHIAIGDTCFAWSEDHQIFNASDGKEVVARENEKSAKRKEDVQEAYTFKHTDITLPYESLDTISAVGADGSRVDIIRAGRFALPGTDMLNEPLDELEHQA